MRFSRHVRELFIFLVVLVAVTNLSSVFLLDRVLRQESRQMTRQLNAALNQLRVLWLQTPPEARPALNLTARARDWNTGQLALAAFLPDSLGEKRWHYLSGLEGKAPTATWDSVSVTQPVFATSGWWADDEYWRVVTRAESWGSDSIVASAGSLAPLLGALQRQMRRELWMRGLILAAFGVFAALFYRLVLLPFRDMRRRAAALAQSEVFPDDFGMATEDPEYVMATFDVLVHRLLQQAHDLKQRAAGSERRARDLERFNEYMLTSLTTGVVIVGSRGEILRLNPSAELILRVDGSDVIGSAYDAVGFYPEMVAVIEEGLRHGYVYSRREMRVERDTPDGPLYLGINTSRIRNEHDEVVGLSVLLTDLTEIKRLYDELAENQRLADLGEMAAGLAHQLRNSIAAVLGYGKLLREAVGPGGPNPEWVEAILNETNETAGMLTRFLDFARPLSGERCSLDLLEVIRDAVESTEAMASAGRVRVTVQHAADHERYLVTGDALLLKQVFINLIQNAVEAISGTGVSPVTRLRRDGRDGHAMPDGGEIKIDIQQREASRPSGIFDVQRRPVYRVAISDTGPGIPEENRSRIFHPFYTSREGGTGLGLPLAKKIAIVHGGNLTLERSDPTGSTFVLTLPAEVPATSAADRTTHTEAPSAVVSH